MQSYKAYVTTKPNQLYLWGTEEVSFRGFVIPVRPCHCIDCIVLFSSEPSNLITIKLLVHLEGRNNPD